MTKKKHRKEALAEIYNLDDYRARREAIKRRTGRSVTEIVIAKPRPELTDQEKRDMFVRVMEYGHWDEERQAYVLDNEPS